MNPILLRSFVLIVSTVLFVPVLLGQNSGYREYQTETNSAAFQPGIEREPLALHEEIYTEDVSGKTADILDQVIDIDIHDSSIEDALNTLSERMNLKLMYSSKLLPRDQRVTLRSDGITFYNAMWTLLEGTDLQFAISQNRQLILLRNRSSQVKAGLIEVFQQDVSGQVIDAATGDPLPGVNVAIEGTTRGTATDQNGEYTLTVPDGDAVLVFSFIGYATQAIPVAAQEVIDVSLEQDFGRLDEVIVVGYGTVERSDLTGSVDRISADQFQNQSISQVSDMLAGTVAGFHANQGTSAAGGSSLEIRGPTSLTAGTSPMIVLDGVVFNGSLRDINPRDIATVDILKDASSAAVFGAKAASGVILITTSKGSIGRPTINLTSTIGRTEVTRRDYGPRSPEEYIQFRTDYFRTVPTDFPDYHYLNPEDLPEGITIEDWRATVGSAHSDDTVEWLNRLNFYGGEIDNYLAGTSTDWFSEVMPPGLRSDMDLSISGGTEDARYYWSLNRLDNEGIIKGDQFSTIRTRLNVDFQVVDWLKAGMNAQYANRDESVVTANLGQALMVTPYGQIYRQDGSLEWFPGGSENAQNPLINTLGQDRDRKINSIFGSLFAELSLPFGINHRVSFQPRFQSIRDYSYWSPETITGGRSYEDGRASRSDYEGFEWMIDNLLTWNRDFGVHTLDVTLLHTAEEARTWQTSVTNNTFRPSTVLGYSGIQFGNNPNLSSNDTKVTGDGMMARVNYSLMNRYLLTASVRRDGFSAFGQENPRATFPAVAFAWQVAEESFFNVNQIDQLKLRLSWGRNGNRDIGQYAALARLSSNMFYDGTGVQMGVRTSTLPNPSLRWEETESINMGVDLTMFGGRVDLALDYYDMTTHNLLVARALPMITGFNSITTNLGELGNRGFEMTLRTVNVSNQNLNWSSTFNFSLNRNKINELYGMTGTYTLAGVQHEGEVPDFDNEWFPGRAIDAVWNYDMIGIWQEEESEEAAVYNLRPGDIKARDLDDSGTYEALDDKMFIGHTEPRYRLGLRNTFNFLGNWTADLFIRADLGHIAPFPQALAGWSTYNRRSIPKFPYWTPENRSNEWPGLSKSTQPYGGGIMVYKPASFVRIQDLSISYNLPISIAEKFQLQSLRIFGSIRNLYSFDNWDGWDPESLHDPMPRTYTLGISLSI